jgi:hypothetical protein
MASVPAGETKLYRNTRHGRLRLVQVALWLPAAFFVWLAWATRIEDPRNNHVAALVLAPIFALVALALEVFLRRYVTALWRTASHFRVETLSTFGRTSRRHPLADVKFGPVLKSDPVTTSLTTGFSLNNAHSRMRVRGRRLPYIIDVTVDPPPG